jgi:hypothetical protein
MESRIDKAIEVAAEKYEKGETIKDFTVGIQELEALHLRFPVYRRHEAVGLIGALYCLRGQAWENSTRKSHDYFALSDYETALKYLPEMFEEERKLCKSKVEAAQINERTLKAAALKRGKKDLPTFHKRVPATEAKKPILVSPEQFFSPNASKPKNKSLHKSNTVQNLKIHPGGRKS